MSIVNNYQHFQRLDDLVIDVSADDNRSGLLNGDKFFQYEWLLFVHNDAATGTLTIEILPDASLDETLDASWVALEVETVAVDIPDNTAQLLRTPPCAALRIASSGTEAGDRTINVWGRRVNVA